MSEFVKCLAKCELDDLTHFNGKFQKILFIKSANNSATTGTRVKISTHLESLEFY